MEKREKIDTGQMIQDYLSATEGERSERGISIITELCQHISLLNDQLEQNNKEYSWGAIKKKFFETKDLLEKLLIIEDFIAYNKIYMDENPSSALQNERNEIAQKINEPNLRENTKLKGIFEDLKKASGSIISLERTTLETAEELYGEKATKLKEFKDDYNEIELALVNIFSDVYEVYMGLRARKQDKQEAHERSKDSLETMGKYGIPYRKQVAKHVDAEMDADEDLLMPGDKAFQKKYWPEHPIENQNQNQKNKKNRNARLY